jgi:ribosome-associated heat shock protein Hsp15
LIAPDRPAILPIVSDPPPLDRVRLDVWLDVACLFHTRSEAQKACKGGKVEVNSMRATPHRLLRAGDEVKIGRPLGRTQTLVVRRLLDRHVPKAEARLLYEDLTPPPSPEEIEARRIERISRAAMRRAGRPNKRERREIRRLKGE